MVTLPGRDIFKHFGLLPFFRRRLFCSILFFFWGGEGGGEMLKYFVVGTQHAFQNNLGCRHVQVDSDSV